MPLACIGIGSNLGRREEHCKRAISCLDEKGLKVLKQSSLYETEPWGLKEQPAFINAAVEVETNLMPRELLVLLKEIEEEMGREHTVKWGPRIIDLDILLYNDEVINEPGLIVPHPLMHKRAFVLRPLSEIAAKKKHPILLKNISDLLSEIDHSS